MGAAVVVWLAAMVAVAGFFIREWLPPAITPAAGTLDRYFGANLLVLGVFFLAVQFGLGWLLFRSRRGPAPAQASLRGELAITVAVAVVFAGAAIYSSGMWAAIQPEPDPADTLRVDVASRQFAWTFRYAGPDGRFGRSSLRLVNEAAGNPFGLDLEDPAARDDVVNAALRIPARRPVQLRMRSHDVIHSLFIRELRLKQDVVPGMETRLTFTAEQPGEYEIACAELCGLGHHQMRSRLIVLVPDEFQRWMGAAR